MKIKKFQEMNEGNYTSDKTPDVVMQEYLAQYFKSNGLTEPTNFNRIGDLLVGALRFTGYQIVKKPIE